MEYRTAEALNKGTVVQPRTTRQGKVSQILNVSLSVRQTQNVAHGVTNSSFFFAKTLISCNIEKGSYKVVILKTTLPRKKKGKTRKY